MDSTGYGRSSFAMGFNCGCLCFFTFGGGIPLSFAKTEKIFEKNREQFEIVADYFAASESESIYISTEWWAGTDYVKPENMPDDMEVAKAINTLVQEGCGVFAKDGNTIQFQMWSNLDAGRGISYSVDKNLLPASDYLIKLEKIYDNWYYYEEDYNEWSVRTPKVGT